MWVGEGEFRRINSIWFLKPFFFSVQTKIKLYDSNTKMRLKYAWEMFVYHGEHWKSGKRRENTIEFGWHMKVMISCDIVVLLLNKKAHDFKVFWSRLKICECKKCCFLLQVCLNNYRSTHKTCMYQKKRRVFGLYLINNLNETRMEFFLYNSPWTWVVLLVIVALRFGKQVAKMWRLNELVYTKKKKKTVWIEALKHKPGLQIKGEKLFVWKSSCFFRMSAFTSAFFLRLFLEKSFIVIMCLLVWK